jgi:predicted transcriptional regulator
MPNQPKTPVRAFRVEDDLWQRAHRVADKREETLSEVVRVALAAYADDPDEFWRGKDREL